ncbi:4-amino-4-deoxy-L-arabinose-phosphoundecaprenol flippase subunit ArnE [bacterium HR17]|jgi:multidrug transporter EmrE-like cation transporter|uniref:4-amino-4-deoxy-L-arabinose-phosphoundecaprenol flippase subunit ArnE n=1 Tax=Candidatus Fervidibacter japonicus TaxID=2035412 RepID=A0A2H5XGC4_9BACT|nr:4-amino-4-deoxy-L-arabinose-phosphoundecaprenol flippase subunit ArnE [bacterium HR17]
MVATTLRSLLTDPLAQIIIATLLGGIGQALIKYGVTNAEAGSGLVATATRLMLSPGVLAGLSAYAVSSVFYVMVVRSKGLSFAYPFVAANQVIVFLLAWLLFREAIPPLRVAGLVVICIGVTLIALSR